VPAAHRADQPAGLALHARFFAMNELRLRFLDGEQPDLALGAGVHALGRLPHGLGPVANDDHWLLQVCNDRRGIWMTVADHVPGVHVNGRPVQHLALLRAGDSIHVDGNELLLAATSVQPVPAHHSGATRDPIASLRYALRGVGGSHHGRSLSLDQPRRIGRGAGVDIRIDGPGLDGSGIAEHHATILLDGGQVLLRAEGGAVLLNGQRVREARLQAGDQIAFDAQHRFVLEGPPTAALASLRPSASACPDDVEAPPLPPPHWAQRVPWLLVAAVLLAAGLSALLLFGAR
jgi:pSer/pThr/pTyr-binding forkhead associated (FHA) protein